MHCWSGVRERAARARDTASTAQRGDESREPHCRIALSWNASRVVRTAAASATATSAGPTGRGIATPATTPQSPSAHLKLLTRPQVARTWPSLGQACALAAERGGWPARMVRACPRCERGANRLLF